MALLMMALALSACECEPKTLQQLVDEADVVFRAELSNLSEDVEGCGETGAWNNAFLVLEVYKGSVAERVNVRSPAPDENDCGLTPEWEHEVLVYGRALANFREYRTDLCAGTKPIDEADADLALLGEGGSPESVGCGALLPSQSLWLLALAGCWVALARRRQR